MPPRTIDRISETIRQKAYDVTVHAVEELAEDNLDILDLEQAVLTGQIVRTEKDDPRGPK